MRSLHPFLRYLLQTFGILFYIVFAAIFIGISILFKFSAVILADRFLYNIIFIGDLLKGIEIIELLNILVFSMLGMALGIGVALLPPLWGQKISAILLIIIVPIILMTTPIVRYQLWLQEVSVKSGLSYAQAEVLTNAFLTKKVGIDQFFGYYVYTGMFPVLPNTQSEIVDMEKLEKKVNKRFVQLTGVPPNVVTWVMMICFWLLRIFYFSIAIFATVNHFHQGVRLAKR